MSHFPALIIQLIQSTGYMGVFVLMALESALIPLPSEVTMPFAGFLASQGNLSLVLLILSGALGNLAGSLLSYALGYYLEESVVVKLIRKYGKFILISEGDYQKGVLWLRKYGNPVAFFSRLLPAVRTFISLPAGLSRMNIWKFSFYTFAGSLLWSTFLAYVGFVLGKNWNALEPYYKKFELGIIAICVLLLLFYLNHKLRIIKFKK